MPEFAARKTVMLSPFGRMMLALTVFPCATGYGRHSYTGST
jgi:hypothetical protein